MSWVCSRVRRDGWLHPLAKPAPAPESCFAPRDLVGKACGVTVEKRVWRQEAVGRLVPHRWKQRGSIQPLSPAQGSRAAMLFHGKIPGS